MHYVVLINKSVLICLKLIGDGVAGQSDTLHIRHSPVFRSGAGTEADLSVRLCYY